MYTNVHLWPHKHIPMHIHHTIIPVEPRYIISLHSRGTASGKACFWIQTLCFCLRCLKGSEQSWKRQSWLWTCRQTAYLEPAPPFLSFRHLLVLGSDGLFQVFPALKSSTISQPYVLITQAQAKSELSALAWCCRIPRSSNYHETLFMENDDLQRYIINH